MLKGDVEISSTSFRHLESQNDQKPPPSKWWRLCQPKDVTCASVVFGLALILSGVLVINEQSNMSSFLDRVAASFKTEGSPAKDTNICSLSENSTGKSTSKSTEDVTGELCRQAGEDIPRGIIVATTDMQWRSLTEEDEDVKKAMAKNLLAMSVGIKQKKAVDEIVQKFPLNNFTIMLFHYDGIVDQWQDLAWSNQSIHVVALHQTKWYLEIMKTEGLEISQPALDPGSLEIHHRITRRHPRLTAHKSIVTQSCPPSNKAVPCTGYVEVMAPVFTRAAWQCVWHMIQNDLVHGWGIDFKMGYCAQGLRSEKVGVIDAEYIMHKSIPSLGGPRANHKAYDLRREVRKKSSKEMLAFQRRWAKAVRDDPKWNDPYKVYAEAEMYIHGNTGASAVP